MHQQPQLSLSLRQEVWKVTALLNKLLMKLSLLRIIEQAIHTMFLVSILDPLRDPRFLQMQSIQQRKLSTVYRSNGLHQNLKTRSNGR